MLEYAYRLDIKIFEDLYESETLNDYYERLAKIFSLRILDRLKKGLFRKYLTLNEELPYLRGRIQFQDVYRKPWNIYFPSSFQEHTSDIDDNKICAWTLYVIIRSGLCGEHSANHVRKAYRSLQRIVSVSPYTSKDCIKRFYDRLNEDYKILHALCRFFIENKGPTINIGDHSMMPFLIDMSKLYELFVAEWLKKNLPDGFYLKVQDKVTLGDSGEVLFKIDLVIIDKVTNTVKFVLDTKYKNTDHVSPPDIHQIVSYAEANDCEEGILIYPEPINQPLDTKIGGKRVRTLEFNIAGDLEVAGQKFLEDLFLLNS